MCCQVLKGQRSGLHTPMRAPWPEHTWPLASSTSQYHKQHITLLKHLVAMRELFLRMKRSIYYWLSGLTLHLFSVALIEWGVALHLSSWLWASVLFCFYILEYFTTVHLDTVFRSTFMRYSVFIFLYSCTGCHLACALACVWLHDWTVCILYVCSPISKALPLPYRANAIRRHHRNVI